MTKHELRFHQMNLDRFAELQNKIDSSKEDEIKAMEEYIAKLEEAVNEWAEKYAALEKQYQEDVPVENATVGYMSHIGNTDGDDEEFEDNKKSKSKNEWYVR